ncbi:MAG TPA: peroxiredoxin [Mycobacteriales bacterium]|nr:peroxiredoxin [Mycobacteriales bacterium]
MATVHAGQKAPEFSLPDDEGQQRTLAEFLAASPVVLFFYPAAMTTGCTAESCHFRDLAAEFAEAGAQRLGISADAVEKQREFSTKYSFDYPLLSDVDGAVATSYGVKRRFGPIPVKRKTFVIGRDGIIQAVIGSEFNMKAHADRALEILHPSR